MKKTDFKFLPVSSAVRTVKKVVSAVLVTALMIPTIYAPKNASASGALKPDNYGNVIYFEDFEQDTQIDTDSLEYKSTLTVDVEKGDTSVTGSEKQGNYAKAEQLNKAGDSYFRIRYEEKSGKATPPVKSKFTQNDMDKLTKMQVSFDICYVESKDKRINVYFHDKLSDPTASTKSQTLMYFGTDGKLVFSNTEVKIDYPKKQWMSFDFYFDFEQDTYSVYLDGQSVIENIGLLSLDSCVESFGIQAGELTASQSYVMYMDNFRIAIPQDCEIKLTEKNGILNAVAHAPADKKAVLIAGKFEGSAMTGVSLEKLEKDADRCTAQFTCEVEDGVEYAFFLLEDGTIVPLCDKGLFYAGIEHSEIADVLKNNTAVMDFALNAVVNGEIKQLDEESRIITSDGVSVASVKFFENVLDAQTSADSDNVAVSLADKTINLTKNSRKYSINGAEGYLTTSVTTRDGVIYIPLAEVLTLLGKSVVTFDSVTIIGDTGAAENVKQSASLKEKLSLALHNIKLYKVTDDDWKQLKDNWRKYLTGDENKNLADSKIEEALSLIDKDCLSAWNSMNKENDVLALFGTTACTQSGHMTAQYGKLYAMAKAYGTYGSAYYKNENLKKDILFALNWLYENLYGQAEIDGTGWRSTADYNWWDWFCRTPHYLTNILLVMEDSLTDSQIEDYLSLYEYLCTTMRTQATPSSAASRIYAGVAAAALLEDADAMKEFREDYELMLLPVESGDGIQEDGLYICHDYFAYTTEYGTADLLDRLSKIRAICSGTVFEIDLPYKYNSCQWIYETFAPITFNGYMTSAQSGRAKDKDEAYFTGFFIGAMLDLIGDFGIDDDIKLKQLIKRNVTEENLSVIKEKLNIEQIVKLNEILNDASISVEPYYNNKIYYTGDSVMHQRNDFGFALSMSSSRIAPWESINGNNMTGWYQGDGMLYTYIDTDANSYGKDYWANVNPYHLPGTTVDTQERLAVSIKNSAEVLTVQDFVGAVGYNNLYATAAMQLESYHNDNENAVTSTIDHGGDAPYHESTLMAKKAYFMFDDEVVALGSDINADDGFEVQTVIENRLLSNAKNVIVDSDVIEETGIYTKNYENPSWVHIEDIAGYFLPNGGKLVLDKVTNKNNFIEMWLSHGVSPKEGSYAYVILPKKTADETDLYSQNPDIEVLSNTEKLQAVKENKLGITGMVFWEKGTFENINVSEPMIVMAGDDNGTYNVNISDPTQLLTEGTVTVKGKYELIDADERCTCKIDGENTVITINFNKYKGKTLPLRLQSK